MVVYCVGGVVKFDGVQVRLLLKDRSVLRGGDTWFV